MSRHEPSGSTDVRGERRLPAAGKILLACLLLGVAAGALGFLRGVDAADAVLAPTWFACIPILGLLLTGRDRLESASWTYWLVLTSPFLVLIGFRLSYDYSDLWVTGLPYSLLSAVLGAVAVGAGRKWLPDRARGRLRVKAASLLAVAAAVALVVLAAPIQYVEVNMLRHRGEGLLNTASGDTSLELPGKAPVFVDEAETPEPFFDMFHRDSLGGPVMRWLEKGPTPAELEEHRKLTNDLRRDYGR